MPTSTIEIHMCDTEYFFLIFVAMAVRVARSLPRDGTSTKSNANLENDASTAIHVSFLQ